MNVRYLVLLIPSLLLSQGGVVDGTVINIATRGGIEGVQVEVLSVTSRNEAGHSATTDSSGAFHIEGIPDGKYRANFGKPGFLPPSMDRPPEAFTVSAAEGPVRLHLELSPMPKLRGRVLDAEGHAVPGASVQIVHLGGGGRPHETSDKDGAFTFETIIPGSFVLRAIPPPRFPPPKSSADEPQIWAPTYYPSVTELFQAPRIGLKGKDLDGYDIKLRAVPAFHVRGVVVDSDDKPVGGAALKLVSPDSLDARSHAAFEEPEGHGTSAEDGSFDLSGIRPGDWFLLANGKRNGQPLSAVVSHTVSRNDWDNVKIRLVAPFTVRGTVERPEGSRRTDWVALMPGWQIRLMGIPDQDGKLEIDDIVPGKYRVALSQPPPGLYVDSVQFGGRDVMGQTIDVMDSAQQIRVVYKTDAARVKGTVENCDRGTVVLMPTEPALQYSELMHWGRCDASGRFDISGLRPGRYYAAAFDRLDDFSLYYGAVVAPALIARIAERGIGVRVDGGQAATVALAITALPEQ